MKHQAGFTLLEMLAALTLMAVCSSVLLVAFGQSARSLSQVAHSDRLTHAALTVQLLAIVRSSLGDAALDAIISAREAETRTSYQSVMTDDLPLRDKVARLADLRSQEGYMAGWTEEADGSLVLVENHCPICAAATACQGFCRAELDVFRSVLGDADVTRNEHIVSGARRCSYTIRATGND